MLPYSLQSRFFDSAAQIAATVQVAHLELDGRGCGRTLDEGAVVGIRAFLFLINSTSMAFDSMNAWIPATVQVQRAWPALL